MKPKQVKHVAGSFSLTSESILKEKERNQLYAPVKKLSLSTYLWNTACERTSELEGDYMLDLAF